MIGRWSTWEDTLLSLMGRAALKPVPGVWRCQLLVDPTFHPPSCLEVDETAGGVALALVILQDHAALSAACAPSVRAGAARPLTIDVAKGRCWEDLLDLPANQAARFRHLRADVDPRGLEECREYERDGTRFWLRCAMAGCVHTVFMWGTSSKTSPTQHRWVTTLLDLALESFADRRCRDYLARVRR